jgi:hypothetical protein
MHTLNPVKITSRELVRRRFSDTGDCREDAISVPNEWRHEYVHVISDKVRYKAQLE